MASTMTLRIGSSKPGAPAASVNVNPGVVIDATAVNNARIPVRSIQVEGRIMGAKETRQVVFCGAARREVRDLSLREIALRQTLEPPKDWTLSPGEQASCIVVFTDPTEDLREFAAEVVAVQAPPRRRTEEGIP